MRDLRPTDNGRRFSAKLQGIHATGKIRYEHGKYYLCQNEKRGNDCNDKLGYSHSWIVEKDWSGYTKYQVKDFKFIDMTAKEIEEYKEFKKGDVLNRNGDKRTVVEQYNMVLFVETSRKQMAVYSAEELYRDGWRLDVTPEEESLPPIEMSVAEIAKKLGVDPSQLKVVDK